MKPLSSLIIGLIAGAAIGGVVALLYAPQSGKETREKLKQKFKEFEEELELLKGKAGEKPSEIKEDIAAKIAALKNEIDHLSKDI